MVDFNYWLGQKYNNQAVTANAQANLTNVQAQNYTEDQQARNKALLTQADAARVGANASMTTANANAEHTRALTPAEIGLYGAQTGAQNEHSLASAQQRGFLGGMVGNPMLESILRGLGVGVDHSDRSGGVPAGGGMPPGGYLGYQLPAPQPYTPPTQPYAVPNAATGRGVSATTGSSMRSLLDKNPDGTPKYAAGTSDVSLGASDTPGSGGFMHDVFSTAVRQIFGNEQPRVPTPPAPVPQVPVTTGPIMRSVLDTNDDGSAKYAKGTKKVPGKGDGTVDKVHAMLAPGEAVLNKGAAEHFGRDNIQALNHIGMLKMGMPGAEPAGKGQEPPAKGKAPAAPAKGKGKPAPAPAKGKAPVAYAHGTSHVGKGSAKGDTPKKIDPKMLPAIMAMLSGGMPAPQGQPQQQMQPQQAPQQQQLPPGM